MPFLIVVSGDKKNDRMAFANILAGIFEEYEVKTRVVEFEVMVQLLLNEVTSKIFGDELIAVGEWHKSFIKHTRNENVNQWTELLDKSIAQAMELNKEAIIIPDVDDHHELYYLIQKSFGYVYLERTERERLRIDTNRPSDRVYKIGSADEIIQFAKEYASIIISLKSDTSDDWNELEEFSTTSMDDGLDMFG